jgi:hypothetical protein
MLALKDQWIWDFWIWSDGPPPSPTWPIGFLKADKSLGDEGLRHWNMSHGHATSSDGHHWQRVCNGLVVDLLARAWPCWLQLLGRRWRVCRHGL